MASSESTPKPIQWKYFRTSIVMYLLFYILPIVLLYFITRGTVPPKIVQIIMMSWVIGGVSLVAAIAAYRSNGAAFFEPALALVAVLILAMLILMIIDFVTIGHVGPVHIVRDIIGPIVILFLFGLLSLFGSWIGGRIQKASQKNKLDAK